MFQFTTTNVINSDKELLSGKDLWETKDDVLRIKKIGSFKKDNVLAIYKAAYQAPELAKVTIDLGKLTDAADGDIYRLNIYVGLTQASQDSRYSNDLVLKGKPFSVDFVWKTNAATTAATLLKTINKYAVLVYTEKLLNASVSSSYVSLEALTEYQRFRNVSIEKLDADAHFGMGEYTVVRSLEDLTEKDTNAELTGEVEGYFVGKESFGSYSFILHNLRIPTEMRTYAFAPNQDETPIIGAQYNQYTIRYCVDRGPLGLNAVGDSVKSVTTHVFYVKSDFCEAFETELAKVGTVIEVPSDDNDTAGEGH